MWHAAPLIMGELATYSPSSSRRIKVMVDCRRAKGRIGEGVVGGCDMEQRKERHTNEDGPYIDEDEEDDVRKLLERKYVGEDVIGHALSEPV